jgi:hypothetical protein
MFEGLSELLLVAFWHELLRRRAKAIPVRAGYAIRFLMDNIFKSLEKCPNDT